jgi:hypothetical protein
MIARTAIVAALATATLITAMSAEAGSVYQYDATATYSSFNDSPFAFAATSAGTSFFLEDFEDGALNTLGVTASDGMVRLPGMHTDSVDGDDGSFDGRGNSGHAWLISPPSPNNLQGEQGPSGPSVTFTFDAGALGQLPTMAGIVWTDGNSDALFSFEAFDSVGNSLGVMHSNLGDGVHTGSTAADRFFGVNWADGISAIVFSGEFGGIEMDHLQYGFSSAVVPVPPAVLLGCLGIVGIAARRRFSKKNA